MLWGVLSISVLSLPVISDTFTPSHSCSKPYKPYQFNSQRQIDNFNDDVEAYRACISDFVDEQTRASEQHRQAASDAMEDWNQFVQFELN